MQGMGLLSTLIWLPIVGGLVVLALGDARIGIARWVALGTAVAQAPAGALSGRERDVLDLAARGWSSRQIGLHLGVAASTVDTQVASGLRRLGLTSRRELAASWAGLAG